MIFPLILGTPFSILGTRIGSLKRLKKTGTREAVMEYFIHNVNTVETKTNEEQETRMSSMDT